MISFRSGQVFEYTNVRNIYSYKNDIITEDFEKFKNNIYYFLTHINNLKLYVSLKNNIDENVISVKENPKEIISEIEKYISYMSTNAILAEHLVLALYKFESNKYNYLNSIIYHNDILKNRKIVKYKLEKLPYHLLLDWQKSLYQFLISYFEFMGTKMTTKSLFEYYSNEKKTEYAKLKEKLKLEYIKNKVAETQDTVVNILKKCTDLQCFY